MTTKALALISGGLDSILAIKLMLEQGIEVIALNFTSPFHAAGSKKEGSPAANIARRLGIELKVDDIGPEHIEIVKRPRHGFGRYLNPCLDCRILMLKKAKALMPSCRAGFIITGEVLGQRPMSQYKSALRLVEKESGLEGFVLRPLSARLLPVTIPEKQGIVDRDRLWDISGRTRKIQMALAREYNISGYLTPAGGCLLTDKVFAGRMQDLLTDREESGRGIGPEDIELLKLGRHFRLSRRHKVVIGRNQKENMRLLALAKEGDISLNPRDVKGPIGIGQGDFTPEATSKASQIVLRYSDCHRDAKIRVEKRRLLYGMSEEVIASAIDEAELEGLRI